MSHEPPTLDRVQELCKTAGIRFEHDSSLDEFWLEGAGKSVLSIFDTDCFDLFFYRHYHEQGRTFFLIPEKRNGCRGVLVRGVAPGYELMSNSASASEIRASHAFSQHSGDRLVLRLSQLSDFSDRLRYLARDSLFSETSDPARVRLVGSIRSSQVSSNNSLLNSDAWSINRRSFDLPQDRTPSSTPSRLSVESTATITEPTSATYHIPTIQAIHFNAAKLARHRSTSLDRFVSVASMGYTIKYPWHASPNDVYQEVSVYSSRQGVWKSLTAVAHVSANVFSMDTTLNFITRSCLLNLGCHDLLRCTDAGHY